MKKLRAILFISMFVNNSFAQDLIDPYRAYVGQVPPFAKTIISSIPYTVYDSKDERNINGGYTGEYMISLNHSHWANDWYYADTLVDPSSWAPLAKTYKMEVVSFPFTLNCFNDPLGCASSVNERKLFMPEDIYSSSSKSWGDIKNIRDSGLMALNGPGAPISGGDGMREALVSTFFIQNVPFQGNRNLLPHTIIKHTVYLHCTSDPLSDKIDSIVWVYDNTRGRMNYYPFVSDNLSGANGSYRWDVVFLPELISKPYTLDFAMLGTHYNDTSNNDWVNGGTINYHLSNNGIATPCNPGTSKPYFPNSQYDLFAYSSYNTYNFRAEYDFSHGHPGPFSLYTTYLRNSTGTSLAGYLLNSGLLTIQTSDIGIKHKYFIDKGFPFFDLSVINPTEKIIYNPSEVTVIADVISSAITEIVFPTGYTFKTILGRYPSTYEVNDANTIENGGPYSDPRDVPVPVNAADLVAPGGNLNYPEVSWDDPSTWLLDERYGYYYMENNGKITVEPCVRIFDAIFESKQGGTLIFEEYPSVKNPARFKTITDGGAVLKNYAAIQYVQNGIITQPYPLIYIAQNKIYAGKQVDPDATALVGSYTVESGANVTFRATETVYLKNGFHAKNGSAFRAHCPNITYTPCNATFAVSGSRMASNNTETLKSHSNLSVMQEMVVSPNPGNGVFEIKLSDSKTNYHLSVTDIYGRMIVENNSKVGVQNLDLRNQPAGIYFVTAITPSKKLIEKIIKQ